MIFYGYFLVRNCFCGVNSPALYRLSYRGMYSVFLARNMLEGSRLWGLVLQKCSTNIVGKKLFRPKFINKKTG